ncbi:serine/threonine protein kinase [Variovorax sp. YR216]|uniref:serine/threonine protein kinase n=1 Tax=Variovorax sp. YR216 TaxID=1882828 RepID=UPI000895FE4C|nr:serine/threonine protein kinase [Variovorax sp. YR216]SEA11099.1 Serine/threonine protein kinase [Variovorax sp. YR216]
MTSVSAIDSNSVLGRLPGQDDTDSAPLGWSDSEQATAHTLPEGMRLLDYEIVGPIGEGGFGIVYLAWDHSLEQHVAIKEYLPAILATRASVSSAVVVKSQRHRDSFRVGMRSFLNEARLLARFDHPSLVRVLHFWEDNGTAYMAMPYYEGPTLQHALAELGRPPTEEELCNWLRPLLDALGTMHAASCFHRDIAPDNILLTDAGPVLLDFGAARRVIDGMGSSPTVVFKPGYAPIEQYGEVASMRQGAWTDLYALAGVVYAAVTGHAPMPAIERLMEDRLQPLSDIAQGQYSESFLAAIDAALSLHPRNRPQSAAEFWTMLSCGEKLQDLELVRAVHRNDALAGTPVSGATVVTDRPSFTEPDPVVERELAEAVRVPPTMPPAAVEHVHTASDEIDDREEPVVIRSRRRAPVSNWPPLVGAPAAARQRAHWGKPAVLAALAVLACAMTFVYYRSSSVSPTTGPAPAGTTPSAPAKPRAVTMRVAPALQEPEPVKSLGAPRPVVAPVQAPQPLPAPAVQPAPRSEPTGPKAIEALAPIPAAEPPKTTELRKEKASEPVKAAVAPASINESSKAVGPAPAVPSSAAVAPSPRTASHARQEPRRLARREQPVAEPESEIRTVVVPIVRQPAQERVQGGTNCTDILQRASLGSLSPSEAAQLRKGCE